MEYQVGDTVRIIDDLSQAEAPRSVGLIKLAFHTIFPFLVTNLFCAD